MIDRWLTLAIPRQLRDITSDELARAIVYCGHQGQQLNQAPNSATEDRLIEVWQQGQFEIRAVEWCEGIEPDRLDFRNRLDRFLQAPKVALREMRDDLDKFRSELLVIPKYRRVSDELVLDLHYFPTTLRAGYGFVLDVLMSTNRGSRGDSGLRAYGEDLRRCALDDCRAHFLSTPKGWGGPRTNLCSDACKSIDVRRQAAQRQREHRAGKSKKRPTRNKP